MVRRFRVRRWGFLALAGAAAIACGLDVIGDPPGVAPEDASVPVPRSDGTVVVLLPDVLELDASVDAADAAEGDGACVADGAFCNLCNEDLLLCIRFDGGARDESRFARAIGYDGSPSFISDNGLGALSLDGSFSVTAAATEGLRFNEVTIEMLARIRMLPPSGSRSGFIDRGVGPSMFVYNTEAGPYMRCQTVAIDAAPPTNEFVHFACTIDDATRAMVLYLNGQRVGSSDAAQPLNPIDDAAASMPLTIGRNDPSGDDFIGDIATLRVFSRVKSARAIANAADASL